MDKNSALRIIKNRKYAAEERAYEINLHLSGFERFGKLTALIHKLTIDEIKGDFSARQKKIVAEKELSEFLASLGFSEEDLKPRYFCKKCGDTGFYEGLPCKCLTELMGGTERSRGDEMTFENAEPSINSKFMDYCRKYADNSEECKLNLFVYGAAGTGKTYALNAIKNRLLQNEIGSVLFFSAFDLEREFLKIHLSDPFSGEKTWNALTRADYLIIDDLGTEPIHQNVTVESFFNLFDKRACALKHTVATTNLTNADLITRYTARTFSRLTNAENTLAVELKGADLRHRTKKSPV